jgi:hypothetical protein
MAGLCNSCFSYRWSLVFRRRSLSSLLHAAVQRGPGCGEPAGYILADALKVKPAEYFLHCFPLAGLLWRLLVVSVARIRFSKRACEGSFSSECFGPPTRSLLGSIGAFVLIPSTFCVVSVRGWGFRSGASLRRLLPRVPPFQDLERRIPLRLSRG